MNGIAISDIKTDDISITPSPYYNPTIYGKRSGNVVSITIDSTDSIAPRAWREIGTIDNAVDRPKELIGAVIASSSVNMFALVEITTAGVIQIYNYTQDGSQHTFGHTTITYIV